MLNLALAERGSLAWLRCLDIDQVQMLQNSQLGFVVPSIGVDFKQVARLGAVLDVTSEMIRLGGASFKLEQIIINFKFCHIVARLIVDIGFVKLAMAGKAQARRMSKDIKDKLARGQVR